VLVEDLFYNTPSRLRAIKSPADEYGKVLDVVGRYACHCAGVAFTCKKAGDAYPALNVPAAFSRRDRVRAVYGSAVATELIEVAVSASEKHGLRRADALVTNPNYSAKRPTPPVLFINGRAVACDPLRKALTGVYTIHLPRGGHYFAYLSLEIDPRNLDVNVHPTKREVRFLYEDEIVEHVCAAVQEALAACGASRTFQTQTVLPGARASAVLMDGAAALNQSQTSSQKRPYEYNLVRTDSKQAKLTTLFSNSHTPVPHSQCTHHEEEGHQSQGDISISSSSSGNVGGSSRPNSSGSGSVLPLPSQYRYVESRRDRVDVRLKSVAQLREAVATTAHEPLTRVLADHTYIGVVDHARRLAAFQHGVRMFVVDYGVLCQEYFYQVGVADFGNFGTLTLGEAGSGVGMQALLNVLEDDGAVSNEERSVLETVWDMREMLHEYFSITLVRPSGADAINTDVDANEIQLVTLPMLVKGWVPALHKLPYFVRELVLAVNWEDECECLEGVLRALSKLYTPEPVADSGEPGGDKATVAAASSKIDVNKEDDDVDDDAYDARRRAEIEEALERLLFPAIQRRLLAPRWLADHVVEIANLPGLYKVFERC
jgi:DNA mismatch repair protein MLH1